MAGETITDLELEKIYRPSSTLIIAAKTDVQEANYNYRLLMAKRSMSTAFAPDHYVFPGGVFDAKADCNEEWLLYFQKHGITSEDFRKLSLQHLQNRPKPLMTNNGVLQRDISLRITAIRETFEEVGILLCINPNELKCNKTSHIYAHNFDKLEWQQKVHENATEFLNLCKFLDVVPDLWSLYEWSIWRSPPTATKKYDTVIYILTLCYQPELLLEPTEVEKELWTTPAGSLELFQSHSIWLAPPQFYEISRLANCTDWVELQTFIRSRSSKGSTLLMPAYFQCTDFLVAVLPGDDAYPVNNLELRDTNKLNLTVAKFKDQTRNIHRLTYYDMYSLSISSNIKPLDGHYSPVHQMHNHSKL